MLRDPRKVRQSLLKKSFIEVQGTNHILYEFTPNGISTEIRTFMSRNNQDIDDYLISKMQKQLFLDKNDFLDLIDCPLYEDDYIKILKGKNLIKE